MQAGHLQLIEVPSMYLSVNKALYAHFKIWDLKCENILEA